MEEYISDDERKLIEVLKTLSSFPLSGFEGMGFDSFDNTGDNGGFTDGVKAIKRFASEQKDVVESVRRVLNQTSNLQIQLFNYLFSVLEEKKTTQIEQLNQMKEEISNKQTIQKTYTPPEIRELAKKYNVRGKTTMNTIISHLNNGTLIGEKQSNGKWVIKREDVAKYLGRDDF